MSPQPVVIEVLLGGPCSAWNELHSGSHAPGYIEVFLRKSTTIVPRPVSELFPWLQVWCAKHTRATRRRMVPAYNLISQASVPTHFEMPLGPVKLD